MLDQQAKPEEPAWLAAATPVGDDWDALEAASGDAPYILEPEEVGEGTRWVTALVPIATIHVGTCNETPRQREDRLEAIRQVPEASLFRPILEFTSASRLVLLDGGHRIDVANERGRLTIDALIRIV